MVYKWKDGFHTKLNAEIVHQEFDKIGDCITADEVVKRAKNPKSKLHNHFEWDDIKAAHEFRLTQARTMISSLIFIPEDSKQEMKCYENVIINDQRVYAPIEMIFDNTDMYEQVFKDAKNIIRSLDDKLRNYENHSKKIHTVRKKISHVREEIEAIS
jgi:hypothetical protein